MTRSPSDPEQEVSRTGYGASERADENGSAGDAGREGDLDATSAVGSNAPRCELCGGTLVERHCKIVCLNCGYQRDCSDP